DASLPAAAGQPEGADLRGIRVEALREIVADIPDRTVVARIQRGLRVVLPSQRVLRRLSLDQDRLAQREKAGRIGREPSRKALAGKVRRSADGVADCDVPGAIDRRARHPAEVPVRRVRSLLVPPDGALYVDPELVPSDAAPARGRVDGVHGDERLLIAD